MPPTRTSVFPAPTVNFQNDAAFSAALPDRFIVMVEPVPSAPEATNRQTDVQTPSPATPPTVLVNSPSFVHVPVPPVTDVWSFVSPSVVEMLSVTTTRMPWSPAASAFVTVVSVKEASRVLPSTPVPSVPTEVIAITPAPVHDSRPRAIPQTGPSSGPNQGSRQLRSTLDNSAGRETGRAPTSTPSGSPCA